MARNSGEALCASTASLWNSLFSTLVRLPDARAALVLQPGAALVDPAQHERRDQHHQHRLQHLEDDAARDVHCANTSSAISVRKLYSR